MTSIRAELTRTPATKPLEHGNRRPDIQGLRAIAVLMVVAFHAGLPVPGGFVGVDVFFVISGFVITAMLQREWSSKGRIDIRKFYLRRFKRLVPALSLMIVVTTLLSMLAISPLGPQQNAARTALGAMLLSANAVIANTTGDYFSAAAETNPLLNLWSLSVEEQFYLCFPAALIACWVLASRWAAARMAPFFALLIMTVASFGLTLPDVTELELRGSGILLGFYGPLTRAWEFTTGALLALSLSRLGMPSRRAGLVIGLAGACGLVASVWLIGPGTPFPGTWTLLPVGATLLLLLAGVQEDNILTRWLSSSLLVRFGDWSYSIYLWHWPIIVLATYWWPQQPLALIVAAAGSLIPALASYYLLEQPVRNRSYTGWHLTRLLALTVVPPILVASLVRVADTEGYWSPTVREYQASQARHTGNMAGCHTEVPISERSAEQCRWNATAAGPPIYLVGDSHADQWSEALIGAAESLERPITITTLNNCPFFGVSIDKVDDRNAIYRYCGSYFPATMDWLVQQPDGVVVIATTSSPYSDSTVALGPNEAQRSHETDSKLSYYAAGMANTVSALQVAGHKVLLVQDTPIFGGEHDYEPTRCTFTEVRSGRCATVLPLEALDSQEGARNALRQVASTTGADVVDLRDQFCTAAGCPSRSDQAILYRDRGHISAQASKAFSDEFIDAIKWVSQ